MKSYKVFIDSPTWMCEGNLVESSRICRYMLQNGHEVIDNSSEADYIVINSCGFIKARIDDSVYLFKYYNSQKKEKASIIMFGCLIKINNDLINSLDLTLFSLKQALEALSKITGAAVTADILDEIFDNFCIGK